MIPHSAGYKEVALISLNAIALSLDTGGRRHLRIQLLGDFRVTVSGVVVDDSRWARKKAETLVKLLAVEPGHEIHRERLLELLWPELEPDQALNNLHKAVHAARRALEPDLKSGAESRFITTNDRRVSLRPATLSIDAEEFEQQAKRALALPTPSGAELESALALMTGEFLASDRLEDWASVRRERINGLHQDLYLRLATIHERDGDTRQATELLRRAVTVQPANEDVHRQLMRLYAATGNRHLALTQFRTCCEILRKELDADPEPATIRLHEQIQAGQLSLEIPLPAAAVVTPAAPPAVAVPVPVPESSRRNFFLLLGGGTGAIAIAAAYVGIFKQPTAKPTLSLAVLPLAISNAAPIAHLADGLTEGLIGTLSRLPRLRVMARSTVFAYKDHSADPRSIARAMGVSTVLTGRVDQDKDQTQVAVELVDATDGARLWGKRYLFRQSELPTMATQVASDVANALSYSFESPAQRLQLTRPATGNPQAYELYLRGRYQWNQRSPAGFRKAIEYFEQAIALDSRYALAYSGLADCYGLLSFENAPPGKSFSQARAMALKALALDDQLAEAHTSLAMVKALYDWDWQQAESGFQRAIALSPGHATAHHWYAVFLNSQGRFAEAKTQLDLALELDPLSPSINTNTAYPAHYQRDYAAAIAIYRKVLDLDPAFSAAREDLVLALEQSGQFPQAAVEAVQLLRQEGDMELARRFPVTGGESGYRQGLKLWRDRLESLARTAYVSPAKLAEFAIRTGDKDAAFRQLDLALQERSAPLAYLKRNPLYDPLRRDPRFESLLRRSGQL